MNKKQILINGKILSYYENLNGEKDGVLVFLHGWMQDGKSFQGIFEILEEKNIPYISFDLPGFGTSQLVHGNMNIDDYAQHICKGIEKLGLTNPVFIGHSFGGKTILNIQEKYAGTEKIVLICSAGVRKTIPSYKRTILKTGKIILSLPGLKGLGAKVKSGLSSPDYKNAGKMEDIFRNAIAEDYTPQMQSVTKPCLLIWGDGDDQTPLSDAQYMKQYIRESQLEVLKGSHFIHQEEIHKVTELILEFIKK